MIFKEINYCDYKGFGNADIRVTNGVISEIGENLTPDFNEEIISYKDSNRILLPAFTDLHVHFRDPGLTYKEDVESGSKAALKGGFTTVNIMPNTKPVCDNLVIAKDVETRITQLGLIDANQSLSMTKNLEGQDISHLKALQKGEVLCITDDGKGVNDDQIMEEIFNIAKLKDILILSHAETSKYSASDMRKAENEMTFRDISLCEKTGGRIHFCHVSTKEAIAAIIEAKKKGLHVSCEVTPHHIFKTAEEVANYRVNPPFRAQEDIDALIEAMQQGYVDAIATDHAPHSEEDKQNGAPGISGIETAFALCYTKLVKQGFLTLPQLLKMMSFTPAQMMKRHKGSIEIGQRADFVIADLETPFTIDRSKFLSKGKNTPFHGREVFGKVLQTVFKGEIFDFGN